MAMETIWRDPKADSVGAQQVDAAVKLAGVGLPFRQIRNGNRS
jgi:hypothetical protein